MKTIEHQYLKRDPTVCFICGEHKDIPMVTDKNEECFHKCGERELQGDGRWIFCTRCKCYLDQRSPKQTPSQKGVSE